MRPRELAAHLQRAEGALVSSFLDPAPALARRAGVRTRRLDGVVCLTATKIESVFLNRAIGVGTIAEATPRLLERIERHYASVDLPSRITIATGCVSAATLRQLERRGYVPESHAELIYVYDGRRPPAPPSIPGLTIERVRPRDAATYSRTGYESFRDRGPSFRPIVEALVRSRGRGLRAYLGRIDGEPAATGMLMDVGLVGALGNGSVRPAYRGRGIQRAMIAHRVADGWARGYRIFFGETVTPASARNMEKLGWRKLYDEIDWVRPTP